MPGNNPIINFATSIETAPFHMGQGLINVNKFIPDQLEKTWAGVDDNLTKLARNAGYSADMLEKRTEAFVKMMSFTGRDGRNLIQRYAFSSAEIGKKQYDYTTSINRNVNFTLSDIDSMLAIERQFENGDKIIAQLSDFLPSMGRMGSYMGETLKTIKKQGLSAQKVTGEIEKNLSKAQEYTFSNGINGLRIMAEEASKLNFSVENTFKAASNLDDIQKSIEVSAKLQVLGGNFTMGSNPMEMFYEATTSVEDLQNRIVKMYQGMARVNDNGEIIIDRFNKRLIKESANALGLNSGDVFKMIERSALRNKIEEQINTSNLQTKDNIEYVLNTASMNEKGEAYVNLIDENGDLVKKNVNKVTDADIQNIVNLDADMQKDSLITLKSIASHVKSIKETSSVRAGAVELGHLKNGIKQTAAIDILNGLDNMISGIIGSFSENTANAVRGVISAAYRFIGVSGPVGVENYIKDTLPKAIKTLAKEKTTDITEKEHLINLLELFDQETAGKSLLAYGKALNTDLLGSQKWGGVEASWEDVRGILEAITDIKSNVRNIANSGNQIASYNGQHMGGPITVPHSAGGPINSTAASMLSNGGLVNDYYSGLGPTVSIPGGTEKVFGFDNGGIPQSIGLNEVVMSAKAVQNGFGGVANAVAFNDKYTHENGGVVPHNDGGMIGESALRVIPHSIGGSIGGKIFLEGGDINLHMDGGYGTTAPMLGASLKDHIIKVVEENFFRNNDFKANTLETKVMTG